MSLPPVPCAHCGINFMRRNLDADAKKLCNSCENKQEGKKSVLLSDRSSFSKILIEVDQKSQIEIEELCSAQGISFSDYFSNLHKTNFNKQGWKLDHEAFKNIDVQVSSQMDHAGDKNEHINAKKQKRKKNS